MIPIEQFEKKEDRINYLIKNKKELINLKKSAVKYCDAFSTVYNKIPKSIQKGSENDSETLIKTIVGNTYNWMDSHDDVHLNGVFSKSISEKSREVFHLRDHEYKISAKIGNPISIIEQDISWTALGVNKQGNTQALIMQSEIINDEYNKRFYNDYKLGKINQHSVGMQYIKLDLAINDPEDEEAYKVWNDNINKIANKEKAEALGYFWAVKEAKLIEISAVLVGSNELTPTINSNQEPLKSTLVNAEAAQALHIKDNAQAIQQIEKLLTKLRL